ncbi:MAG: DUF5906 domain-containing protein [Treponema sp.]|nr:DUF5906 domain-containing protein [Treponema sp.]
MHNDSKGLTKKEKLVIEELSRDLRSNKFVQGQMQFTDITNRDYFLKAYGDTIKYCITWNKFLIWNGTCWEIDKMGHVEEMCVDFLHKMYRGLRVINDIYLRTAFEKHLIKSESYRRIISLIGVIKMSNQIKVSDENLDKDDYFFNVSNFTIDLKNNELLAPDSSMLITKKSRFIYEKDAKCPTWNMFLMQIFNNDYELIRFVQKAMGYSLSGDISEQCLFILWGIGANGKSTFLNVLQYLFGDYACSTGTETFMKKSTEHSNDLARLKGARLVTTSEAEQGKALSESLIKQITGEDEITARFLYGEYFSFRPTFKIFMATNHKPRIRGADEGIWRRIKMIPFTVTFPPHQRDKNLKDKLIAENSGILNWLIEGYMLWKKEGLADEPDVVKKANLEYRYDMDSVGTFVSECFDMDGSMKWRLTNKLLYDTYIKWCVKNNERALSQKRLSIRMQEKGFKRCVSNSQRFWLGLVVKAEWMG